MQVNTTASVGSTGTPTTDQIPNASQTLNQNDFLQLLVSQMENQDPLNPQSDTDMAAQMAQFTSLQQSSAMSGSLSMLQANSLIGSTVSLQLSSGATTSGTVQSVQTGASSSDGTTQIVVNGMPYDLNQILSITPTVAPTTTPTSSSTTTNPATN